MQSGSAPLFEHGHAIGGRGVGVCGTRTLFSLVFWIQLILKLKKPSPRVSVLHPFWFAVALFGALFVTGFPRTLAQQAPISLTASEADALTTFQVRLDLSPTRTQELTLDFGFGSNEAIDSQGFLDSFSMTLQKRDGSATALFFTMDRTGLQLAPANAGGVRLQPSSWRLNAIPAPSLLGGFDFRISYELTLAVPAALGTGDTLFFDLFSNQDGVASAGYFQNLTISPPPVVVQSASILNGVFTDEPSAVLDLPAMTADVPKIRPVQFFRVRGNLPVKVTLAAVQADGLAFDFEFRPSRIVLMSAATQAGPFTQVTANFDLAKQTATTAAGAGTRVFRIDSDVPVAIQSVSTSGGTTTVAFRFQAGVMTLLSSPAAGGPYVESVDATFDADARKIRAPQMASRQVFD